jgi:hypothetical protein
MIGEAFGFANSPLDDPLELGILLLVGSRAGWQQ